MSNKKYTQEELNKIRHRLESIILDLQSGEYGSIYEICKRYNTNYSTFIHHLGLEGNEDLSESYKIKQVAPSNKVLLNAARAALLKQIEGTEVTTTTTSYKLNAKGEKTPTNLKVETVKKPGDPKIILNILNKISNTLSDRYDTANLIGVFVKFNEHLVAKGVDPQVMKQILSMESQFMNDPKGITPVIDAHDNMTNEDINEDIEDGEDNTTDTTD